MGLLLSLACTKGKSLAFLKILARKLLIISSLVILYFPSVLLFHSVDFRNPFPEKLGLKFLVLTNGNDFGSATIEFLDPQTIQAIQQQGLTFFKTMGNGLEWKNTPVPTAWTEDDFCWRGLPGLCTMYDWPHGQLGPVRDLVRKIGDEASRSGSYYAETGGRSGYFISPDLGLFVITGENPHFNSMVMSSLSEVFLGVYFIFYLLLGPGAVVAVIAGFAIAYGTYYIPKLRGKFFNNQTPFRLSLKISGFFLLLLLITAHFFPFPYVFELLAPFYLSYVTSLFHRRMDLLALDRMAVFLMVLAVTFLQLVSFSIFYFLMAGWLVGCFVGYSLVISGRQEKPRTRLVWRCLDGVPYVLVAVIMWLSGLPMPA